jgi:hypothetical protein
VKLWKHQCVIARPPTSLGPLRIQSRWQLCITIVADLSKHRPMFIHPTENRMRVPQPTLHFDDVSWHHSVNGNTA